jgi:peptidoglycan/LPS O-acetylase OafA/YrhL
MKRLPKDIAELTAFRAFAAAWVVLFHFYDNSSLLASLDTHLFNKGYLGVDAFFILSGFILGHVYGGEKLSNRDSYVSFLWNRFARVYPLHLFTLLLFIFLYVAGSKLHFLSGATGMRWDHLPFHILLLHAWGTTDGHSWNFPSWSISAEAFAYLLFPWLLQFSHRIQPARGFILSVVAFLFANWAVAFQGARLTGLMYNFGIVRILFEFSMGLSLCRLLRARPGLFPRFSLWLSSAALVIMAHLGMSDALIVLTFPIIIGGLAERAKDSSAGIMRSCWLVYFGKVSYSTYLIHYAVQLVFLGMAKKYYALNSELPTWAWLCMVTSVYFASMVCYHMVEEPARKSIRDLVSRKYVKAPSSNVDNAIVLIHP